MAIEQAEVEAQTEPQEVVADEQPATDSIEPVEGEVAAEETPEVEPEPPFDPASILSNQEHRAAVWESFKEDREREKADHANQLIQKRESEQRREQAKDEHTQTAAAMVAKAAIEAAGGDWNEVSNDPRIVERLSRTLALPLQANLAVAIEQNFDELAPAVARFMGGTEAAQKALLERVTEAKTVGEKSAAIGVLLAGAKENIESAAEEKWKGWAEIEAKRLLQAEIDAGKLEAGLAGSPKTIPNAPRGSGPGSKTTWDSISNKYTDSQWMNLPADERKKLSDEANQALAG